MRPRSKNGAKNQNLHLRRYSFVSVIILFVSKKVIFIKECQNRMKNDRVMPIRRFRAKVAVGLFWGESWLFWSPFFKISTSNLLPEIYIKIDRKNKLEVNRTQNDNFSFQKAT